MSDDSVRVMARAAIRAGKVPNCTPHRMWGGQAAGAPCTICGLRLSPTELAYEIEFGINGGRAGSNHIFHIRCFKALESERQTPGLANAAGGALAAGD